MDPYQSPDNQKDTVVEAMISRLESRGENAQFNGFIDQYLAEIDFSKVQSIVDLGCGTGVSTRRIASRTPENISLTGVDISERFLEVARERSDTRIHWLHIKSENLPFHDNSVDVVVLHTLLSHVPDPVAILSEARRILTPQGTLVIFDADYASTTYAIPDFRRGREIDHILFRAIIHNLDVCRMMPRHLKAAGLQLTNHIPHIITDAGKGDFWLSSVQGFAKLIPALKILPEAEGDAWVESMLSSHEEGTFFASGNYFTYFAQKE